MGGFASCKLSTEESLIEASEFVFVARRSCIGSNICMTSGDSKGLLIGVWPKAELTSILEEERRG